MFARVCLRRTSNRVVDLTGYISGTRGPIHRHIAEFHVSLNYLLESLTITSAEIMDTLCVPPIPLFFSFFFPFLFVRCISTHEMVQRNDTFSDLSNLPKGETFSLSLSPRRRGKKKKERENVAWLSGWFSRLRENRLITQTRGYSAAKSAGEESDDVIYRRGNDHRPTPRYESTIF